ncbi:MAG: hypothetical protein AB7O90_00545 [Hyphomicrobium sp.]
MRLIVTNTDSGAGAIKAARIADRVFYLGHNLTHSPAPTAGCIEDFFQTRSRQTSKDREDWETAIDEHAAQTINTVLSDSSPYHSIELWMDPDTNSQLQLIQILSALNASSMQSRIKIFHASKAIGEHEPTQLPSAPEFQDCTASVLGLGASCWRAFTNASPANWFELLQRDDLELLPNIQRAIIRMLAELPAAQNGLSQSQKDVVELVSQGAKCAKEILATLIQTGAAIGGYWQTGQILGGLAQCDLPAISGLPNTRFDLALHDDERAHSEYMSSTISLTEFGERLLNNDADYAERNKLDYWWAGTHITNLNLWRWSAATTQLIAPHEGHNSAG